MCDHRPHSELAKSTPKARCSSTGNLKNYERIVRRAPLRAGEGPLKPPFVLRNAPRIAKDKFTRANGPTDCHMRDDEIIDEQYVWD